MVTQKNVFRINCVMIPDSMVTKTCSVDKRNPPKNKINNDFSQRTFSQRSPKGKQNEIVVLSMVFLFKHTWGPGEKNTQKMRKRRYKEKINTNQKHKNIQTRYEKKTKGKRKHKNKIGESQKETQEKENKQEEDKTNNRKKKHGTKKKNRKKNKKTEVKRERKE